MCLTDVSAPNNHLSLRFQLFLSPNRPLATHPLTGEGKDFDASHSGRGRAVKSRESQVSDMPNKGRGGHGWGMAVTGRKP